MIRRIYIDNFRCLVNFDLKLEPLVLLLGPNGAGKTTVFEVLHRLRAFVMGDLKVGGAFPSRDLCAWDQRAEQIFRLQMEVNSHAYMYELVVEHEGKPGQWKKSRVKR